MTVMLLKKRFIIILPVKRTDYCNILNMRDIKINDVGLLLPVRLN